MWQFGMQEMGFTDGEISGNEDLDITDEHAMLLQSGIILKPRTNRTVGMLLIFALLLLTHVHLDGLGICFYVIFHI